MGYQIIAASADRPAKLKETLEEHSYEYQLVSDHEQTAAQAFGLAFRLEGAPQRFINLLEEASGRDHHILPVPGVFIIGTDGVIDFSYVNPDYKVRLEPDLVLAAARAYAAGSGR